MFEWLGGPEAWVALVTLTALPLAQVASGSVVQFVGT
jgi:hypothetical protein